MKITKEITFKHYINKFSALAEERAEAIQKVVEQCGIENECSLPIDIEWTYVNSEKVLSVSFNLQIKSKVKIRPQQFEIPK